MTGIFQLLGSRRQGASVTIGNFRLIVGSYLERRYKKEGRAMSFFDRLEEGFNNIGASVGDWAIKIAIALIVLIIGRWRKRNALIH